MSYYRMHRGWMDNTVFARASLSEREAWCWLIEKAAWKDRQYRIGSNVIELKRGQLCASLRYLGDAWGWGKDKVRRYLSTLQKAHMISAESATTARQSEAVITICNYSLYQSDADTGETQCATETRHLRDSGATDARQTRDKTEESKEVKEVKELDRVGAYAFNGRVIKLNPSDFDAWKSAYHTLDLRAALTKIDAWMVAKGRKDDWFFSASKWLEKDHQEALQARKASEPSTITLDALYAVLGASNRQTAIDLLNAAKTDEKALAVSEDARQSDDPVMFVLKWIGRQTTTRPELFTHLDPKYRPFTADFRQ